MIILQSALSHLLGLSYPFYTLTGMRHSGTRPWSVAADHWQYGSK